MCNLYIVHITSNRTSWVLILYACLSISPLVLPAGDRTFVGFLVIQIRWGLKKCHLCVPVGWRLLKLMKVLFTTLLYIIKL